MVGYCDLLSACLFEDSFKLSNFVEGIPNSGDAFFLFFLILSKFCLDFFEIILISIFLPHVLDNGDAFIIGEVIDLIIQLFDPLLIALYFLFLLFFIDLQLLYVLLEQRVDLPIGLEDAFAVDLLHRAKSSQVLLKKGKFWLIVDQSFSNKFAEIFA